MQQRVDSKAKLPQYHSLKQYQISKQPSKKPLKPSHIKPSPKQKLTKANPHSQSKTKLNRHVKPNENFNSMNVPSDALHKTKSLHHELQNLKRQQRKEQKTTRNSTQKLIKSKSTLRLQPKTQRHRLSPSPNNFKQGHPNKERNKITDNLTSRPEKDKKIRPKQERIGIKRSGSIVAIHTKKQNAERIHANRVSIKTEGSSKMNSVIKQDEKSKKSKKKIKPTFAKKEAHSQKDSNIYKKSNKSKLQAKIQRSILYSQVSFQQYCQQNPCESALVINDRFFVPHSNLKVKTQGCRSSSLANRLEQKENIARQNSAAIIIQRVFRGFITRKYIEQAKFIISRVRIIQRWWRRVLKKRKTKLQKPLLSIESSLITIKDFNDTIKTDRHKMYSQSKQNTLSNHKLNIKELIKNILQQDEQSQKQSHFDDKTNHLRDRCLSPQQKVLTKQVYVQHKIMSEITSQRIFNSPKPMNSPNSLRTPTNINCNIKQFFNNSSQKQKIKQMLHSPRLKSPQPPPPAPPKTTPKSSQPPTQQFQIYHAPTQAIQAIQTNFQAIQEISLLLVDFFRDRQKQMQLFLTKIEQLRFFRTDLILKNWNRYTLLSESFFNDDSTLPLDYQFLQRYERPIIFSQQLREDILRFPQIEIDLNNKNYDFEGVNNCVIHRSYIDFIFDALEQAFYQKYRHCLLSWATPLRFKRFYSPQNLFQLVFSDALGCLVEWNDVMCGLIVDHPEDYQLQLEERMKRLDKQVEHWDLGEGSKLGIKIQISQKIVDMLIDELQFELTQKCL